MAVATRIGGTTHATQRWLARASLVLGGARALDAGAQWVPDYPVGGVHFAGGNAPGTAAGSKPVILNIENFWQIGQRM